MRGIFAKTLFKATSGIVLEKLTKEDVLKAEEHFGVKLPREYVDLLHIQNGGYLLKDSINIDIEIDNGHTLPIDYLLGIKENKRYHGDEVSI